MNSKLLWKSLSLTSTLLGAAFVVPGAAIAQPAETDINQIREYSTGTRSNASIGQVTSVSQLRDVRPTDWAFQALQSLVERYGCIAGYPNGTYRGNRAMTRYEFAAGVNACLDRINELIAAATANLVTREDLAVLQRLQEEFAAELATLRGRVDSLEARVEFLEDHQFSTTTKLKGEAIFAFINSFGDDRPLRGWGPDRRRISENLAPGGHLRDIDDEATFAGRVRLNFDTSFTGEDSLRTRLQAGNIAGTRGALGSAAARVGYATDTDNAFEVSILTYRFPYGGYFEDGAPRGIMQIGPIGQAPDDLIPTFSVNSSGSGTISRFSALSPIYRGVGDAGITGLYYFTPQISLGYSYLAGGANNPGSGSGLFNGDFQAMGQLSYEGDRFGIGFTYARDYVADNGASSLSGPLSGGIGTLASDPFRRPGEALATDSYGIAMEWAPSDRFVFNAWGQYSNAQDLSTNNQLDDADIWNWLVGFTFPDLGAEGNVGGLMIGMPPHITSGTGDAPDTPIHLEAFYKLQLTDNISVTPGFLAVINPEGDSDNDTVYVGTIRTTFKF
ncbi:iron uptake porin [Roseofilum casamattae]|uniref:Iron uptake porin n=1 Tax=Roseofilum casamattae BLCC-M143 TaxID=3022442 RepID=A0ABT7C0Y5_9CYAN|nr:iron uptake porin [Roseofilum casamattae]MDJ1185113.1 iron uptake porin [Roseofilum casamattae BLCC-M143]